MRAGYLVFAGGELMRIPLSIPVLSQVVAILEANSNLGLINEAEFFEFFE